MEKEGMLSPLFVFIISVWENGGIMERSLDFEGKLKKLLKSQVDEHTRESLDFLPEEGKCTWINAMCLSLANKAIKGDISAIKYINEICSKTDDDTESITVITIKVIE